MRVFENVFRIPSHVNSYLIEKEYNSVLIDAGMEKNASKVIDVVKSYCPDKPLKALIITHAHLDHTRGLETLGQLFGPEVIAHKDESAYIMKVDKMPSRKGFSGKMFSFFARIASSPGYTVDQVVTDGEVVHGLKVFHLPGHTPGTIALEDIKTRALFCGDIINTNKSGTKILPPHKTFALDYDKALESSIKMLKLTRPKAIMPGHVKPILEPEEAIETYLENYS